MNSLVSTNRGIASPVCSIWLIIFVCLLCCTWFLTGLSHAAEGEFTAHGELILVSPHSHSAVIDVASPSTTQIIGGKLAVDAILLKGSRKVDLRSFEAGDKVKVLWRSTPKGQEIISLIGGGPPEQPKREVAQSSPGTRKSGRTDVPGSTPDSSSPTVRTQVAILAAFPVKKKIRIQPPKPRKLPHHNSTVQPLIGFRIPHVIGENETLLDIARNYNLGYNELAGLYPDLDPWLPPVGQRLLLPTEHLLPDGNRHGIVINVPELRLYYYFGKGRSKMVTTYPVGIGDARYQTPLGSFVVDSKVTNPTWYIPESLRARYEVSSIPPGPENPLGQYWLGLEKADYGIHGTDLPWSVGRLVTHGCIRMYPEDIQPFFLQVSKGTSVQIVYEPVKSGRVGNRIFVEVHKDVYGRHADLETLARQQLTRKGFWKMVNKEKLLTVLREQKGIPADITADQLQAGL